MRVAKSNTYISRLDATVTKKWRRSDGDGEDDSSDDDSGIISEDFTIVLFPPIFPLRTDEFSFIVSLYNGDFSQNNLHPLSTFSLSSSISRVNW